MICAIIFYSLTLGIIANSFNALSNSPALLFLFIPLFLFINIFAGKRSIKTTSKRLRTCCHGAVLLATFLLSTIISVIYHIILIIHRADYSTHLIIWSVVLCICLEAIVFWNGIICAYFTSIQLGIKQRVIGVICGMIPIANLIALCVILKTILKEVHFESKKEKINRERNAQQICKTKYPILMVHGVFFRDSNFFNYWGRVPKELEQNGATIYYGNHQSAASIIDCSIELSECIKTIINEHHYEKLNIIAHSKGGLDCRYALTNPDIAPYVASLTTINTPHRGCIFADYLLNKIPSSVKDKVAGAYNATLKKFGDENPDFLAAVGDLTASACAKLNSEIETPEGIFCQSYGSILKKSSGGKFPLNYSYHLVKYFDGANDGLVSEDSFQWGERYTQLNPKKNSGISHGDVIDLNRQNIDGFDVREFYVDLVNDLKNRGF